jgi:hypothetical protein
MAWPKGKPRKATSMGESVGVVYPGEDVVYHPGDGDPSSCKWRGVEFKANVPVRVMNADHVEAARGNKHFSVGSEDSGKGAPSGPPKTAMEYRAHVVDWMARVRSVDDIAKAWSADRPLREKCEVGQDDIAFLGTLFEPKLHQLRLAGGLSEVDVAGIWFRRGVMDLPWRS